MEQGVEVKTNRVGAKGNIVLLQVQGFVDTNTCSELHKHINQALDQGILNLILDMGAVNYVSSAGWGVMVGEIRSIRESGGDLRIVQMMPDVYEVFEMLEFNRILTYYDNMEEAINDFDIALGFDISKSQQRQMPANSPAEIVAPRIAREEVAPSEKGGRVAAKKKPQKVDYTRLPLVEKIRLIIIENPLNNIFQIRKILNTPLYGNTKVSPLKLFQILKKNNWNTESKRIRFYRSR
jgi:anti-anti-sigma factor